MSEFVIADNPHNLGQQVFFRHGAHNCAGAVIDGTTVSFTVIETVASALVEGAAVASPVSRTVNLKPSGPL